MDDIDKVKQRLEITKQLLRRWCDYAYGLKCMDPINELVEQSEESIKDKMSSDNSESVRYMLAELEAERDKLRTIANSAVKLLIEWHDKVNQSLSLNTDFHHLDGSSGSEYDLFRKTGKFLEAVDNGYFK